MSPITNYKKTFKDKFLVAITNDKIWRFFRQLDELSTNKKANYIWANLKKGWPCDFKDKDERDYLRLLKFGKQKGLIK